MPSTYESAVLVDTPIAYYRLDEVGGATTAVDQISGHNATIGSAPTQGATALPLTESTTPTASSMTVTATTNPLLTLPASVAIASGDPGVTLEFWANFANVSHSVLNFQIGSGAAGGYFQSYLPYALTSVYVYAGATQVGISAGALTGSVTAAVHHWAITFLNSSPFTVNLYRDGVLLLTGTGSAGFSIGLAGGFFAASGAIGDKFDNVAIYNKALSTARILAHYQAGAQFLNASAQGVATLHGAAGMTGALVGRTNAAFVLNGIATSPTPAVTATFDILRSPAGKNQWTRIATGIVAPALGQSITYDDYGAAAYVQYDYQVNAVSTLGASAPILLPNVSVSWELGIWLHDPTNPAASAHFYQFDNGIRNETITPEVALVRTDGRSRPIAEFSGRDDRIIAIYLDMPWNTLVHASPDYEALKAFVLAHKLLCFRDHRSRKLYGIIAALPELDEKQRSTTTMTVTELNFSEAV